MRKIILTLSMLSISTLSVFSQAILVFNGVYSCHLTKEISCYIDFQKNGCYTLEINYMPYKAENIETIQLSYGKFTIHNNKIILMDKAHGFSMQFLLQADYSKFTVEKSFGFLNNKVFHYNDASYEQECNYSEIDVKSQKNERAFYQLQHKILYKFYYGTYESPNNTVKYEGRVFATRLEYELKIQKENKYSFYYKAFLISEGTFKRDRNVLSLFDINLQHSFYVLITDKGLISKYLPGEYNGSLLIRK